MRRQAASSLPMDSSAGYVALCLMTTTPVFLWSGHSFRTYVQSKGLTEPKRIPLSSPGPHIERQINEGCTFINALFWSV